MRSHTHRAGSLEALLVLGFEQATWTTTITLPFPPFPGLGIRIDPYDVLNVQSVLVGDRGHDVTCICTLEGDATGYTADRIRSYGFEQRTYP